MQLLTLAWVAVLYLRNNLVLAKGRRLLGVSEVPHTLHPDILSW